MPAEKQGPSTSAKILYRPIGLVSSILGGLIASLIFKQLWKVASPQGRKGGDAPTPLQTEYPLKEILVASALQGVVYSLVKTIVNRQGAKAFERATGEWPGS